jgi:hypothetical protein
MSVVKLFFLSLTMLILSYCGSNYMESPIGEAPFQSSFRYSNSENSYRVYVPKNGQMMRLEVKGKAPMNGWQSFDMEVHSVDKKYLFSYKDELWSESGYDYDGRWTEYKKRAYFDIRFPEKGNYLIYLTDSTNNKEVNTEFKFRAIPIRGSGKAFTPLLFLFGLGLFACILIFMLRFGSDNLPGFASTQKPEPGKKKSKSWIWFYVVAFGLWGIAFSVASDDDDDDEAYRNSSSYYLGHSHRYSQIYVDRSIRQQSLSGSNFRAGSSRGGK